MNDNEAAYLDDAKDAAVAVISSDSASPNEVKLADAIIALVDHIELQERRSAAGTGWTRY